MRAGSADESEVGGRRSEVGSTSDGGWDDGASGCIAELPTDRLTDFQLTDFIV